MSKFLLTLKLNGQLSDSVPDTCECLFGLYTHGAHDSYTNVVCPNPTCYTHKAHFITDALAILGIKASIGQETAIKILGDCKMKSHLDLFDESIINIDSETYGSYLIPILKAQTELKKINNSGGIKLGTYISLFCFPGLGKTRSEDIFEMHSDIKKFYDDMLTPMSDDVFGNSAYTAKNFLAHKLGISSDTQTVNDIYRTLMENRGEIERCIKYFKIIQIDSAVKMQVVRMVITGSVTRAVDDNGLSFGNRDGFPNYLTKKYGINVIQEGRVSKDSTMFLVCDGKPMKPGDTIPSSTKYRAAVRIRPRVEIAELMQTLGISTDSIVVTSKELVALLDNGLLNIEL